MKTAIPILAVLQFTQFTCLAASNALQDIGSGLMLVGAVISSAGLAVLIVAGIAKAILKTVSLPAQPGGGAPLAARATLAARTKSACARDLRYRKFQKVTIFFVVWLFIWMAAAFVVKSDTIYVAVAIAIMVGLAVSGTALAVRGSAIAKQEKSVADDHART